MSNDTNSEFSNITEDGKIKKKILTPGKGITPILNKEIIIKYTSKYDDKIIDESKNEPFRFTTGENEVIKGMEIAVLSMQVGEKSLFIIDSEYAYGNKQITNILPQNAKINLEIELLQVLQKPKEIHEMDYPEKLARGKQLKNKGGERYKIGDFIDAKNYFLKALKYFETMDPNNDDEEDGVNLYCLTLSNLCNCLNKLKEYNDVIIYATDGLKIKQLPKYYYFRGISYAYKNEIDLALKDLENLKKLLKPEEINKDEGLKYLSNLIESQKHKDIKDNKKFSKNLLTHNKYENNNMNIIPKNPPTKINPKNPIVFFDIKIGNKQLKRLEIELFKDIVPKTVENFRCLCTGEKGGKLTYQNTLFFKVIKNFLIEGGDFENNDGTGGYSIYGKYFEDENFYYSHSREGLLSMSHNSQNLNGSQFFITLKDTPWLDKKHVVFGQVVKGFDLLKEIENVETDNNDKPKVKIIIEDCDEL